MNMSETTVWERYGYFKYKGFSQNDSCRFKTEKQQDDLTKGSSVCGEVEAIRSENEQLKAVVAELTLQNLQLPAL